MSSQTAAPTHRPPTHKSRNSAHLPTPVSAVTDHLGASGAQPDPFPAHRDAPAQPQHHLDTMNPPYPTRRSLPSQSFSDDQGFEDAYVQFILYCNPAIPQDINTSDLRKIFISPPRSDSKTFSTRILFELLQQLDRKELKTWTELALKLGVEKPSIEKGQSSQKVQQYSVRLKRWLRASHIDAFFDYMMGKSHSYLEVPPPHDPFPEQRDGVFAEDDLALRALKPEFRPKRGRKRAESDDQEPMSAIEPKRPHLDPAFNDPAYSHSAYSANVSAHPDSVDRFQHDQWATPATTGSLSAAPHTSPGQVRWRLNDTPSTPHPPSAVSPSAAPFPDSAIDDESASQSQKMKMRRRHGTAVSSAWPSNSTTPNGKLRGRPPTNRSVKDGPFISFPANAYPKEGPAVDMSRNTASTPIDENRPQETPQTAGSPFRVPAYPTPTSTSDKMPARPGRLSVTVPEHVGNPVSLVTPTLAVNGGSAQQSLASLDDLKRALVADLLKADVVGRAKSLRGAEAKNLAEVLLAHVVSQTATTDDIDTVTIASWLGLNPPTATHQRWTSVMGSGNKKITFRDGHDVSIADDVNAPGSSSSSSTAAQSSQAIKQTFDIEWDLRLGALTGKFAAKGLPLVPSSSAAIATSPLPPPSTASATATDTDKSWEQRCRELEQALRDGDAQMQLLRDRVLDAVL